MQRYTVDITRLGWGTMPIAVEANSYDEAKEKACDEAGNYLFSDDDSEYLTNDDSFYIVREGKPDCESLLGLIMGQKKVLPLLLGLDEELDAMIERELKSGGD